MKIKICGMKYNDNIANVANLRPDYLGFIFYEKSQRFFDGTIPEIDKKIKKSGVFVNEKTKDIIEKINQYPLKAIQLHGNETPEFCDSLKRQLNNEIEIIKAFSISENFNFSELELYEDKCDYFLFDSKGKSPGGNGFSFDWKLLKNYNLKKPYFLSGGIGLDDSDDILNFLQKNESQYCYALDLNSRFEIKPGLKNIDDLIIFINKIK